VLSGRSRAGPWARVGSAGCDVPSNGARRRSCGEVLLREMREHGGVDPDYATVIFGGARVVVSKIQLKCSTKC
jgi:hypothetical protein